MNLKPFTQFSSFNPYVCCHILCSGLNFIYVDTMSFVYSCFLCNPTEDEMAESHMRRGQGTIWK